MKVYLGKKEKQCFQIIRMKNLSLVQFRLFVLIAYEIEMHKKITVDDQFY
jgi:hypothetical protein